MPQVFHVLRCYSCKTFQVHQVKKATRWSCKLCGEKQSIKNVYGDGTGADCRRHVQKLNMLRAAGEELTLPPTYDTIPPTYDTLPPSYDNLPPTYETATYESRLPVETVTQSHSRSSVVTVSKWGQYVTQIDDKEGLDDDTSNDVKFTLDRRTFEESQRERKRPRPSRAVRGQKRKCSNGGAQPGTTHHHAIDMSSGSRRYTGESNPAPQPGTRNIHNKLCGDRVTHVSTNVLAKVTRRICGDNTSAVTRGQVVSGRTGLLSGSTNTAHASRHVLSSRHPHMHQNTTAVVSTLSDGGKQGIKKGRNHEKESCDESLSSGSKWAQFVTAEEDADSSDSDVSESERATLQGHSENIPNIPGESDQQKYREESSQNVSVTFSRNISENLSKTQHCPNFSLGGDDDDDDLDTMIADWPVA